MSKLGTNYALTSDIFQVKIWENKIWNIVYNVILRLLCKLLRFLLTKTSKSAFILYLSKSNWVVKEKK